MKKIAIAFAAMLTLGLVTPATAAPTPETAAACLQSEARTGTVAAADELSSGRRKWKRHGWHGKRKWHRWHGKRGWKHRHVWYGKRYWRHRHCWRVWFNGRRVVVCR